MKCTIPGSNARVFAKAFQCLSRIGDVLYMESLPEGLTLRTINNTKSAFAKMVFLPSFFSSYANCPDTGNEDNFCRLSMKLCLKAFKNIRLVELCTISLDTKSSILIIKFKCKFETVKTHYVRILEYKTLNTIVTTEDIPNQITASYKIFNDLVSNFQLNEEEITIETAPNMITVQNYMPGSSIDRNIMKSRYQIQSNQFDEYSIEEHTILTFCLRELRALLNFAEILNLTVNFNFETAGRPVIFVLKNSDTFESTLVMSTQQGNNNSSDKSIRLSQTKIVEHPIEKKQTVRRKNNNTKNQNQEIISKKKKTNHFDDDELFNFVPDISSNTISIDPIRVNNNSKDTPISLQMEAINVSGTYARNTQTVNTDIQVIFQDTDDAQADLTPDLEILPPSPKTNKNSRSRFIFRRCFESTFNPNSLPGSSQVLAENSDPEDD